MDNQEIFTPKEAKDNNQRKHELIKLVDSGEAVLVVGAGSSMRVKYPDWSCLLQKLEDLASECGFTPDNVKRKKTPLEYLEYIQKIKSYIDKKAKLERYHSLLHDIFKPKSPLFNDFHKMLVSLPFRGILTTNYDIVLEAALGEIEPSFACDNSLIINHSSAGRVHEFLMAMNNEKRITRRIAHLHGKFDLPNSIILSIEDYNHAYGLRLRKNNLQDNSGWTLHRKLLWAVLATRRVVFIGFSLDDPYFEMMLEIVSQDLWSWDKSIHFAIMSISPDRADHSKAKAVRLKREYGVDTVFYEDSDESHSRLYHIVAEIAAECGVEIQSTIIPQVQLNQNDCSVDEAPESAASESGDVLNWLEKNNQGMERRIDGEN